MINEALLKKLSGHLVVKLSKDPTNMGSLYNQATTPDTIVLSATMKWKDYYKQDELNSFVIHEPTMNIRGYSTNIIVEHVAENGKAFTLEEVMNAISKTENISRQHTDWFGGPDIHHVYYEGISKDSDNTWNIDFGS